MSTVPCFAFAALGMGLLTASPSLMTARQISTRDLRFETRSVGPMSHELTSSVRVISFSVRDVTVSVVDAVAVRETPAEIRVALPADILFDFDKAVVRDAARAALAAAASILRAHAESAVEIDGHADSKGTDAQNKPLSLKRAQAVRQCLTDREGLRLDHLKTAGFGSHRPAVPNSKPDGSDDPDGRQRNRRVEIVNAK